MNTVLNDIDSPCVAQAMINYIESGVLRITEQLRPQIYPDGNKWCCLYGEDIQSGVCGFGDTPREAINDWEMNFYNQKIPNRKEVQP